MRSFTERSLRLHCISSRLRYLPDNETRVQLDWLKSLTNRANLLYILVGNFSLYDFCHLNGQASRRMRDEHFARAQSPQPIAPRSRSSKHIEHAVHRDPVGTKEAPTAPVGTSKCSFLGPIGVTIQQFQESGIWHVECQNCGARRDMKLEECAIAV